MLFKKIICSLILLFVFIASPAIGKDIPILVIKTDDPEETAYIAKYLANIGKIPTTDEVDKRERERIYKKMYRRSYKQIFGDFEITHNRKPTDAEAVERAGWAKEEAETTVEVLWPTTKNIVAAAKVAFIKKKAKNRAAAIALANRPPKNIDGLYMVYNTGLVVKYNKVRFHDIIPREDLSYIYTADIVQPDSLSFDMGKRSGDILGKVKYQSFSTEIELYERIKIPTGTSQIFAHCNGGVYSKATVYQFGKKNKYGWSLKPKELNQCLISNLRDGQCTVNKCVKSVPNRTLLFLTFDEKFAEEQGKISLAKAKGGLNFANLQDEVSRLMEKRNQGKKQRQGNEKQWGCPYAYCDYVVDTWVIQDVFKQ